MTEGRKTSDSDDSKNDEWMAYIDHEVRDVCREKGWGHQIRRKTSAREKPVCQSPVDDYEWKLIPGARGELPEAAWDTFDEGIYYVLSFDCSAAKFVLQHDTAHCGDWGLHFMWNTYTEIQWIVPSSLQEEAHQAAKILGGASRVTELVTDINRPPPEGFLRDHILALISRFGPNHFSIT